MANWPPQMGWQPTLFAVPAQRRDLQAHALNWQLAKLGRVGASQHRPWQPAHDEAVAAWGWTCAESGATLPPPLRVHARAGSGDSL